MSLPTGKPALPVDHQQRHNHQLQRARVYSSPQNILTQSSPRKITHSNRMQNGAARTTQAATILRVRRAAQTDIRARAAVAARCKRRRQVPSRPLRTPRRAATRSSRGSPRLTAQSIRAAGRIARALLVRWSGSLGDRKCRPVGDGE